MDRNYDSLGLSIAVVPSEITVDSIKQSFKLTPVGLRQRWPEGDSSESSVQLKAEQFCLGCHVKAKVGDVLGTVTVRSYLSRKEATWWQEVRVTASALSIKIVMHISTVLKDAMHEVSEPKQKNTLSDMLRELNKIAPGVHDN